MRSTLLLLFLLFPLVAISQDTARTYHATRTDQAPKVDGILDEAIWSRAQAAEGFRQYLPIEGANPDHPTKVMIVYDDVAIYVAAIMYDSAPDSILTELGNRDAEPINADYFKISFDTYNNQQDAFVFGTYSSGVQFDVKISDPTFDAVWESTTSITVEGWVAELRIPYSAIRFPKNPEQTWGLQLTRSVRRTREVTQWSLTPNATNNALLYWGKIDGINDVKTPLRLSFTPYLSVYGDRTPFKNSTGETVYSNSISYNAGADVKYGIDERFTLDLTLLPDFGQVQSDSKIKNLSYREVTYAENRPFFKESVELFDKDNLFYSRRIGDIPTGYYSVESQLQDGETIDENPSSAKLLNALKISGRTDEGMGIGFFNAVTENTYAVINTTNGETRRVLTEPLTNYNVIVLDQQLKNNSKFYFINTNVIRDKGFDDANVTGSGFTISNKKNSFAVDGKASLSQQFTRPEGEPSTSLNDQLGFTYFMGARKLGGSFQYGSSYQVIDDHYYTSDLGYQTINNEKNYRVFVEHHIYQPWKFLRNSTSQLFYSYGTNYITGKTINNDIDMSFFATFLDYNSIFGGGGAVMGTYYDYFEPRVPGRYSRGIRYYYSYLGVSTDYRKKFALDLTQNVSNFIDEFVSEGYNTDITARYRVNDKLTVRYIFGYYFDPYNYGFADIDDNGDVIYGLRIMNTIVNTLNLTYIFKNDMSLNIYGRHYWQTGEYRKYFTILENGEYEENLVYNIDNDFNYNAFNIDMTFTWRFAPGSDLTVAYKNSIESDIPGLIKRPSYDENFKDMIALPQTNSLSLKVLYYLDYNYLKRKK
jgi:hypothetical protein